jgi:hypothetical protein
MGGEAAGDAAGGASDGLADLPLAAFGNHEEDEEDYWSSVSFMCKHAREEYE